MSSTKCRIKKDDKVKVVAGKEKGKMGKVLRVLRDKDRLIIENVNFVKRHSRPGGQTKQGGIIEKEASVHWSNVMLVCPNTGKQTRIGKQLLSDGSRARVSKKSGEMLND